MKELRQILNHYESDYFVGFAKNYKNRSVEELEQIILEYQFLYVYGDDESDRGDLIPPEDWFVFHHWEPSTQSEFLAYFAIKIAVLRN